MSDQEFTLSASSIFRFINGYPNPDDDSPRGPFDPIGPISTLIAELARYLNRRISDPPTWGGIQRPRALMLESWQLVGEPDPSPWLAATKPDPTPWLALLVARSHAVQLLELDRLAQHLPDQQDQLEEQASRLALQAIGDCGTLTPGQLFLNYLKRKKFVFPPKGQPYPRPNCQELILMANEFYQVGLLTDNAKISAVSNTIAEKLLERGLSQL